MKEVSFSSALYITRCSFSKNTLKVLKPHFIRIHQENILCVIQEIHYLRKKIIMCNKRLKQNKAPGFGAVLR